MQSEDFLAAALRKLAEQDREREAPDAVEARVVQAFRQRQVHRKWRNRIGWSLAAAAALTAVFLAGVHQGTPPARYVAPAHSVPAKPPQLAVANPPVTEVPDAEAAAPVKARRPPLAQPAQPQSREVVTQFFPLVDVAPPFERGELLRVTVPASTMRKVGLPVNEDRLSEPVYADVLVGQEGLARAIRFVSYEQ